jgi:archaemetzincin
MSHKERISIIVLSEINEHLIEVLRRRLELTFDKVVEIRYAIQSLGYAYDAKRRQYVSPRLIARLRRIKKNKGDKVLGITDVDLYSPDYDYVYGEAEMASDVATLSLYRLKGDTQNNGFNPELLEERAVREAIHELGHLYQLGHCASSNCVMHACPSIAEVDKAGPEFCSECVDTLERNLVGVK